MSRFKRLSISAKILGLSLIFSFGIETVHAQVSRDSMEKFIMEVTYKKSCDMAKSQNAEIAKMSDQQCIDALIQTRGSILKEKMRRFSDQEVRSLYNEYGGR